MKKTSIVFLLMAFALPLPASAAATFEVTGWIPYWRVERGVADTLPHLDLLTEVNPFVYTLRSDGTLLDNGKMDQEPWLSFIAAAKAKKVRVIPTVMTSNGTLLHTLLSNTTSRIALEDRIAKLVIDNNYDGIDIDFEGKKAATKDYFSTFLKGLDQRLGSKFLMCTIETRTPLESRYFGGEIPKDATIYANDFKAINKYCDRVRIMAYDQQGIDRALAATAASSTELYAPVADPRWVMKVVELMTKDIAKSKMLIGVPTYGYEYDVTAYAGNEYSYKILWTFNPGYATQIAQQLGITPARNSAGELYFTYQATSSTPAPVSGVPSSMFVAAAASAFATANNSHQTFRLVDWPDGQSVAGKIELAQMLGVRGISIFKFDGGEDPGMWTALIGAVSTPFEGPVSGGTQTPSVPKITAALKFGMSHSQVRALQMILNGDPDTRVASSGAGSPGRETTYFGAATKKAVGKFQLKWGIVKTSKDPSYGTVGPKTRAKLNELSNG